MDPITLGLQITDKALDILLIMLKDQPPERRTEAWEKWFKFWDGVEARIDKLTNKGDKSNA